MYLRALAFALLTLSCGDSSSDDKGTTTGAAEVKKTVGPDGDVLVVGGATVTIPKGALTTPIEITIAATDVGPPDGFIALSKVFTCSPSGTNFTQPVVMQMPFTDDGKPSSILWSSADSPAFKSVGGTPSGGTMTATVMHFSSGFVGRPK